MSSRAALAHGGKNEDIEVLRAVAVLLTIACHFGNLLRWDGTWSELLRGLPFWGGVDLFFCISGFVITGSLLHQGRADSFARLAVPFYIRRVFRIWPAAILWLIVPLVAARYFNVTGAFGHFRDDLPGSAAAVLQVANLYSMVCSHGDGMPLPCGKAEVYWSLSLEEQFYLIFPFLLFFLRRNTLRWVLIGVILAQIFLFRPVESAWWNLRTDAISFGVLIALAQAEGRLRPGAFGLGAGRSAATWLASGLIVAVAALSAASWLKVNVGLLALASAGLVVLASDNADVILPIPRLRPFLLWVGSRSYAIYLVHNPCYWATRELIQRLYPHAVLNDAFTVPFVATALVLIALASEATYRLVETPLRVLGRDLASRDRGVRRPAASGTEVLTAVGGARAAKPATRMIKVSRVAAALAMRALRSRSWRWHWPA